MPDFWPNNFWCLFDKETGESKRLRGLGHTSEFDWLFTADFATIDSILAFVPQTSHRPHTVSFYVWRDKEGGVSIAHYHHKVRLHGDCPIAEDSNCLGDEPRFVSYSLEGVPPSWQEFVEYRQEGTSNG